MTSNHARNGIYEQQERHDIICPLEATQEAIEYAPIHQGRGNDNI